VGQRQTVIWIAGAIALPLTLAAIVVAVSYIVNDVNSAAGFNSGRQ